MDLDSFDEIIAKNILSAKLEKIHWSINLGIDSQ